jgi:Na+-transporting NADH:ubiquinone oxidoreductase subunit NqrF
MSRIGAASVIAAFLFVSTAIGLARADEGKDGKCTIAVKGDSPTAKACAKGGRTEAKKMMKEMVKQAKAAGQKFTCDGCHKDLDNYELTKNAPEDFKKLEAVSKTK